MKDSNNKTRIHLNGGHTCDINWLLRSSAIQILFYLPFTVQLLWHEKLLHSMFAVILHTIHPIILNVHEQLDSLQKYNFCSQRVWGRRIILNIYYDIWMEQLIDKMWLPVWAFCSRSDLCPSGQSALFFLRKPKCSCSTSL